jgi:hypothetical protein
VGISRFGPQSKPAAMAGSLWPTSRPDQVGQVKTGAPDFDFIPEGMVVALRFGLI